MAYPTRRWLGLLAVAAAFWPLSNLAAGPAEVRSLLHEDLWREALERAYKLRDESGPGPEIDSVLGQALYRGGKFEEALALLEPLAGLDDAPPRALVTLGLIRAAEADYGTAWALMERALEATPGDPWVLYRSAGFAPTRKGRIELLQRYLEVADGEDPDLVEAARGQVRLIRALGDRRVWVSSSRPESIDVPLRRLKDGYGNLLGYTIAVSMGTRDKPVRLLFDTGSSGLFVTEKTARKRGFTPLSEETTFGGGGSGRHRSGRGVLDRFELGDLEYETPVLTTSPRPLDRRGRYDGLIGLSVLQGYRIVVDLSRGRLLAGPAGEEPGAGASPFWDVHGQIVVRVEAPGDVSGLFILDTGAQTTLVDRAFAETIEGARLGSLAEVFSYGGARDDARRVERALLRFQGLESRKGAIMNAADLSMRSRLTGVEISGFLGLDFLAGTRITVDTGTRTITLERGER